jgi:hypothetical protein
LAAATSRLRLKIEIHGLASLVHGSVQIHPSVLHLEVGFVTPPGTTHPPGIAVPALLEISSIVLHPAPHRRAHGNATLSHHAHQIPITQFVAEVPTDAHLDLLIEVPALNCYSVVDGLPNNDVRSALQSADETFWIGTAAGLSVFHPDSHGPPFRNYSSANSLSDSNIFKLFEDSNGSLWMGTTVSGVMKMVRQGFASFDARDGFLSGTNQESIFETVAGEPAIISEIGCRIVVHVLNAGRFRPVHPDLPLERGGLNPKRSGSLQDRFGEWWIGTGHGLFRFPKTARALDLAHLRPNCLHRCGRIRRRQY